MNKKKIKLEVGDVLSINLGTNEYAFARVLSKLDIGHCIEIFDFIGNHPKQYTEVNFESRLLLPQIIDSYSLFWLRNEGDWELVSKQKNFTPSKDEQTKFLYGDKMNLTLIDIFGNTQKKAKNDDSLYAPYSPKGDIGVKRIIKFWREKNKD